MTAIGPRLTAETSDEKLFDILCWMLAPLNDGHVNLKAKLDGKKRHFRPEEKPRFWREFADDGIDQLFATTG
jgi:hypothetical protein